jgi:4-hydroxy-tetrahydrodipicolinate synthase
MNDRRVNLIERITGGLIPAVPVPFRGTHFDTGGQQQYAEWMAAQPIAGVAVWAHTGRGLHLGPDIRRSVLDIWREALGDKLVVAGAKDVGMAIEARRGKADAILAFPQASDTIPYHRRLGRELPVIAFYLYESAGGVEYDDRTLHAIMELPEVVGIKVATLDSVMTFQRVAAVLRQHPDKLLITGEDRFLGYSLLLGARAALIGMGAALPDVQADLVRACLAEDWHRFISLSNLCDRFSQTTFIQPMEGYIRRMLWAAAAEGAVPEDACDDPWGPSLPLDEREAVERVVRDARAARA